MKSLNRTLSLVLVLVMVLGLFGIAGAAFTDQDEIQYTEAVAVAAGIGAINGYEDGSFKPAGNITREEAAKMVTYAVLGADLAKTLTVSSTGFTDVDAGRWSAPFIAYLVSKGVINGMGDGTFDPTGNVTGYQLAKMLLTAAGYGKNGEYTGTSWELNTAIDASRLGIFTGTKATNFTAPATREEAALYVFNGITEVKQVAWDKNKEDYDNTGKTTIGVAVYGLDKNAPELGDDGLTGYTWAASKLNPTNPTKAITDVIVTDTILGTYGPGTTAKAITADLKITAATTGNIQYYANGVARGAAFAINTLVNDTTTVIPYGVNVTIAKAADGSYKALQTIEYLAKVKTVTNTNKDAYDEVTFTVFDKTGGYDVAFTDAAKIPTGTYKADELYIVVPHGDNSAASKFLSISKPETVDGKVTGQGTGYVRVDGNKLPLGIAPKDIDALNYSDIFTFYLDSTGAIVGYAKKSTVASTDYLYLMSIAADYTAANPIFGGSAVNTADIKALVAFPDGTVKIVDYAVFAPSAGGHNTSYYMTNGSVGAISADEAVSGVDAGKFYSYKETDGKYVFSDVTGATTGNLTFAKNNATVTGISSKYANSATVVTVISYNTVTKTVSTTTYTGIANFPAKTFTGVSYMATYNKTNNAIIDSILIFESTTPVTTSSFAVYVGEGEEYASGSKYQGFYVNGEYVEYKVGSGISVETAADNKLEKDKAYVLTLDSANTVTTATYKAFDKAEAKVTAVDTSYMIVETHGIQYFAENAVCFNIAAGHKGEADTVEVGDKVVYILDTGKVVAVFITVDVND